MSSMVQVATVDQHPARNPHGDGRYIPMLDGWRAVAIVLVLLFHGTFHTDLSAYPRLQPFASLAGRTGALGVLVFFSISGYLITQRLLAESHRAGGMFSLRAFYIKRAFRILPPLAAYLLVLLVLQLCGAVHLAASDLSAPLFLADYWHGTWYTAHFWSLSVEEQYYLFWPICIYLAGWRRAFWVGVGVIAAVAVWRPWLLLHLPAGVTTAYALQRADLRMDYIMMGALVAMAVTFYPGSVRVLRWLGASWSLAALVFVLLLATRATLIDLRSLQALLITLIVCASTMADAPLPRALLTSRPVLFIGKISYSLYVWQELFLAPAKSHFWRSLAALPLRYGMALAAAYASYRLVERPLIRYGRRVLERSSASH